MNLTIHPDMSATVVSDDGTRGFSLPAYSPLTMLPWSGPEEIERAVSEYAEQWAMQLPDDVQIQEQHTSTVDGIWEAIKRERDGIRTEGGVLVGANWFHTDNASRIKWLGLKDSARDVLANGGAGTDQLFVDGKKVMWKTMAGTWMLVTVQLALDVVEAVKVLDSRLFTAAETHFAAMSVATDPNAYDYSTGWPARYGDKP